MSMTDTNNKFPAINDEAIDSIEDINEIYWTKVAELKELRNHILRKLPLIAIQDFHQWVQIEIEMSTLENQQVELHHEFKLSEDEKERLDEQSVEQVRYERPDLLPENHTVSMEHTVNALSTEQRRNLTSTIIRWTLSNKDMLLNTPELSNFIREITSTLDITLDITNPSNPSRFHSTQSNIKKDDDDMDCQ
ncbi:MAG: hypothetical protein Sylvanvirus13_1 [Sylvanvirus sp.]|uniref:Uncharacterized protein n=1 Tax=Sylvanvirus sp. TaxID=2487774 RepID=A0A3G5AJJ2_9VIRU|nr:MAG: hypothetical protein Sylvanvirus13_1 [Sylvanvirus sp.]